MALTGGRTAFKGVIWSFDGVKWSYTGAETVFNEIEFFFGGERSIAVLEHDSELVLFDVNGVYFPENVFMLGFNVSFQVSTLCCITTIHAFLEITVFLLK